MTLRADDGTLLEAKEAIVQDAEGNTIAAPQSSSDSGESFHYSTGTAKMRVLRLSPWLAPVVVLAAFAVLTLGTVFFAAAVAFMIGLGIVRYLVRLLR